MKFQKQLLLLSLALSLGMSACEAEQQPEEKLRFSAESIAVKTYLLQQSEGAAKISSTGMLATENEAKYAFKTGGVIDRIYVREGQSFSKGSLLASLKIEEIEAGFLQARLGLEKTERDLARIANLYEDSVATLEQLQNTRTAYEIAQKQLEAVAFNRSYAYIYAANDGFVTQKIANEGEIVAGGMPVLAINENNGKAWVLKVGLSDKDWAATAVGDKATVILDAYPDSPIKGRVYRKSQAADQSSGSFQVELQLELGKLKPALGMFGKAVIETGTVQQYQAIPYDALIEADGKSAFVFVPVQGGKVKKQAIEIASFGQEEVWVKAGLENTKEIVLTNSAFLNEQSNITIINNEQL
jgi:RND family efflux transporter MFP subunit